MTQKTEVLIIGGGVIGVCAAYFLARQGRQVTLLDRDDIAGGCSYGNAGLIVPSHSVPLARPGLISQGLKWLLDPESPFYIKPRFDLELLTWLGRFQAASRPKSMHRSIPILRDLLQASATHFDELIAEEALACDYARNGLLMIYRTKHGFKEAQAEAQLLGKYGLPAAILDGAAVQALEPAVKAGIVGGIFFPADGRLDPALFVRQLAERARGYGALLHPQTEVTGFEQEGRRITAVKTDRGNFHAEQMVLAAGAWSVALASQLQLKLPLQPAKGYSLTLQRPSSCPTRPLMLGEAWVAVTPLAAGLRLAGTLELAGLDLSVNPRRVRAIWQAASEYLNEVKPGGELESWAGLRPCTPDGLPIISRSPHYDNLIVAAGHAMLGVSLGPVTGEIIAQLVTGHGK